MKKLMFFVSALIFSANVYSQCTIYGDFHYYPEPGGLGWYTFYDVSYGVGLSSGQSYQWKVNNVAAGTNNILHYQFPGSGTYTVCETISDPVLQCYYQPICKTITVTMCPAVTIDFTATNNGNNNYTFTNTSTGTTSPIYYNWTVDGVASSTSSSFSHTFTTSGAHIVCLTITSGGCTFDAKCYSYNFNFCPAISQSFNYNTTNGGAYTFSDLSSGTINNPTYAWKINGTTVATSQNMSYTFTTQGSNEICQIITANGCTYVPLCTNLYICPPILMEVTHTNTGYSYTFTDQSRKLDNSPLTGTLTRYWSINSQAQSTHNQTLNYIFPGVGTYAVCLDLLHNSCIYGGYCGNLNITATDISSYKNEHEINIFPNPVKETLNIQPDQTQVYSVEIIDASGKIVFIKNIFNKNNFSIDAQLLTTGVYTIILKTDSGVIVRRVVKS